MSHEDGCDICGHAYSVRQDADDTGRCDACTVLRCEQELRAVEAYAEALQTALGQITNGAIYTVNGGHACRHCSTYWHADPVVTRWQTEHHMNGCAYMIAQDALKSRHEISTADPGVKFGSGVVRTALPDDLRSRGDPLSLEAARAIESAREAIGSLRVIWWEKDLGEVGVRVRYKDGGWSMWVVPNELGLNPVLAVVPGFAEGWRAAIAAAATWVDRKGWEGTANALADDLCEPSQEGHATCNPQEADRG